MITIVFCVIGASTRSQGLRVGEPGDGIAIHAPTEVTKASVKMKMTWWSPRRLLLDTKVGVQIAMKKILGITRCISFGKPRKGYQPQKMRSQPRRFDLKEDAVHAVEDTESRKEKGRDSLPHRWMNRGWVVRAKCRRPARLLRVQGSLSRQRLHPPPLPPFPKQ